MKNWFEKSRLGWLLMAVGIIAACAPKEKPRELTLDEKIASETILPQDPNMIRTPKGASSLDLESPLRCYVNWNTQEMITTIPYNVKAFNMVRNGKNDMLPRFEVTGFTFATMPAEKAMYKLTKEAGIKLVAKDAPYAAVNCNLAVSTARKAAQDGVGQFLYLSSMSVYGADSGAIEQHTPLSPKNAYGRSKQMAEEQLSQLRSPQFRVCILRPPMVYGTNCRGNYQTLRRIACSVPVFPVVNNRRSMIHIDNLCAWMQWAIDTQSTDLLLPQDPFYVSTSEMVRLIAAAHGKKKVLIPGFGKLLSALPVSAAKKAFGSLYYAPSAEYHSVVRTLEEAISRTEGGAK